MGQDRPGTALVTGAAKRIGHAIALDLATHGWDIAIHYGSSSEAAEATLREVRAIGRRAETVQADLAGADIAGIVDLANHTLGPLNLLVNCASRFEPDTARTVTAESFDRHASVNLRAPVLLTRAFAEQLPDDTPGNVINIIDQRVWKLNPLYLSYTASKFALWGVTRTLAQALAPQIRVNGIGPGPTLVAERQSDEDFEEEATSTLLGHGPDPSEIAAAVRFIVSSPSMTGQMLALDGGQHLAWRTPDVMAGDERSG